MDGQRDKEIERWMDREIKTQRGRQRYTEIKRQTEIDIDSSPATQQQKETAAN